MPIYTNRIVSAVTLEKTAPVAAEPASPKNLPSAGIPSNVLQALNQAPLDGLARPVVTTPAAESKPNRVAFGTIDLGMHAPAAGATDAFDQFASAASASAGTVSGGSGNQVPTTVQDALAAIGAHMGESEQAVIDAVEQAVRAFGGAVTDAVDEAQDVVTSAVDDVEDLVDDAGDLAEDIGDWF